MSQQEDFVKLFLDKVDNEGLGYCLTSYFAPEDLYKLPDPVNAWAVLAASCLNKINEWIEEEIDERDEE